MKIILTIVFAISIASSSFSQKINRIDLHDLQIQRLSDIPDLDFSIKLRKDLSFLTGGLSAWFLSTSKIDKPSHQGISVSFCDQGATIAQNGKIYRKMQIINDSKAALPIQRIDATIGGLQEHFYIDGQWCEQRKSMTSTCGNIYFSQNLEPFSLIEFNLADDGMHSGQVEVKYKISIHLRGRIYYSNVIRVYLHENQYQSLVEATHSR